ncbi:MAG: acyl carrier protein [Suipraeoptans sp.]
MLLRKAKWTKEQIDKDIRKIIVSIMKPHEEGTIEATPEQYFEQIDSLRIMELIVLIEKKFKIEIPTDELMKLSESNLEELVNIVENEVHGG